MIWSKEEEEEENDVKGMKQENLLSYRSSKRSEIVELLKFSAARKFHVYGS